MHDHPWDARTIILRGFYWEVRPMSPNDEHYGLANGAHFLRWKGDTAQLNFGEFHQIVKVPEDGVWTMFITYKYRGTWGFLVDGVKVKWKEYLNGRRN
jgi:uncharacterized protein YwqG